VWTPGLRQEVFQEALVRRFRGFRVSGLFDAVGHVAAGLCGDGGSGPSRNNALEALETRHPPGPSCQAGGQVLLMDGAWKASARPAPQGFP